MLLSHQKVGILCHQTDQSTLQFSLVKKSLFELIRKGYRYFICSAYHITDFKILLLLLEWKELHSLSIELIYCSHSYVCESFQSDFIYRCSLATDLNQVYSSTEENMFVKYIAEHSDVLFL